MLELVLVAGFLVAGYLIHRLTRRTGGAIAPVFLCLFTALAAGSVLAVRGAFRSPPVADRPVAARGNGYVSSDACRSCHPDQYATWKASYHHTMTQVPTRESVLGDFNEVQLERDGVRYRLFRRDGGFWAEWDDPDWTPTEGGPQRIERRMVLMTGSHHDQMYWFTAPGHGDALEQFAFDYSRRLGRWIPVTSSFIQPPDDLPAPVIGQWNGTCSTCHTVRPEIRWTDWEPPYDKASLASRVVDFGIACEACHGPGLRHVNANRNPIRRYREYLRQGGDPSIVQPARLDSRRAAQVCGQCHGVFLEHSEPVRFLPGTDIDQVRTYVQGRYTDPDYRPKDEQDAERQRTIVDAVGRGLRLDTMFWSDGRVRVSGREYTGLIESPCFERGELTCVSCHTLHQTRGDRRPVEEWANDQITPGMEGNRACLQCHGDFTGEKLTAHTRHRPESPGSLCYNCHMPFTVYGIQKAHRSHTVSSPTVDESVDLGRPNACNQCHLDRSLGWTARYLATWYDTPSPTLTDEQASLSAGVGWALRGDAGLRALMAWSMGWEAAREASGALEDDDWMVPYLGQLLDDPYDSVRFVALLALRQHRGFEDFDYDFTGPAEDRGNTALRITRLGATGRNLAGIDGPAVLLDATGALGWAEFARLLAQRDDRPVQLLE